jgi:hypothetical protein
VCVDPRPAFKWLLTQPQRASLREGFAFRSGRLTPAAAQRQRPALFMLLKEGGNASLEAVEQGFPLRLRQNSGKKTLQTEKKPFKR